MGALSGPLADLSLLLRHVVSQTDGLLPVALLGLVLFVSVCLLLCLVMLHVWWKLQQAADPSGFPRERSAIYRPHNDTARLRRRSVGATT